MIPDAGGVISQVLHEVVRRLARDRHRPRADLQVERGSTRPLLARRRGLSPSSRRPRRAAARKASTGRLDGLSRRECTAADSANPTGRLRRLPRCRRDRRDSAKLGGLPARVVLGRGVDREPSSFGRRSTGSVAVTSALFHSTGRLRASPVRRRREDRPVEVSSIAVSAVVGRDIRRSDARRGALRGRVRDPRRGGPALDCVRSCSTPVRQRTSI